MNFLFIAIGIALGSLTTFTYFKFKTPIDQFFIHLFVQYKYKNILQNLPYETTKHNVIDDKTMITVIYELYKETFKLLEGKSAEKQSLLNKQDFAFMLKDDSLKKFITKNKKGEIIGVGMITHNLDNPLIDIIDPLTFRNFQNEYKNGNIHYVPFILIRKDYQKKRAFVSLVDMIIEYSLSNKIYPAFSHSINANPFLAHMIRHITSLRLKGTVNIKTLDAQHYTLLWTNAYKKKNYLKKPTTS